RNRKREKKNTGIHSQGRIQAQVFRSGGAQNVNEPASEEEAQAAASDGEQYALGQHLSHQSYAACSESNPDGNLLSSARGPRQLQAGHIGARQQQHGNNGGEQNGGR